MEYKEGAALGERVKFWVAVKVNRVKKTKRLPFLLLS